MTDEYAELTEGSFFAEVEIENEVREGIIDLTDRNLMGYLSIEFFPSNTTVYLNGNPELVLNSWTRPKCKIIRDAQLYLEQKYPNLEIRNKITEINIGLQQLTGPLDLSDFPNLRWFHGRGNRLTKLNTKKNPHLEGISCDDNFSLTDLDLSENTLLKSLFCGNNSIKKLDLTKNPSIVYVSCHNNLLNCLEIPSSSLTHLFAWANKLPSKTFLTVNATNLETIQLDIELHSKLWKIYKNVYPDLDLTGAELLFVYQRDAMPLIKKEQNHESIIRFLLKSKILPPELILMIKEFLPPFDEKIAFLEKEFIYKFRGFLPHQNSQIQGTSYNQSEFFVNQISLINGFSSLGLK